MTHHSAAPAAKPRVIEEGYTHIIPYPFVREKYEQSPEDYDSEPVLVDSWKPGVVFESDGFDGSYSVADAMGQMRLHVVCVVKPGKYPERVFFTRQWQDPDGKQFGKGALRMTTTQNFRALLRGYRHEYELQGAQE